MQKILKTYLKRLINLGAGNRSLLLLKPPKSQYIDLKAFSFLVNKADYAILEELLLKKKKIEVCAVIDPRFEASNLVSKQLAAIAKTAKTIEEESGNVSLFLGYAFVEGRLLDDTLVRAPLLFLPVNLTKNQNTWSLESRPEEIQFNYTFLTAYSHYNKVKFSDEFSEMGFNGFAENALDFKTKLYELLKESPLEINFNSDTFQENILPFEAIAKSDFVAKTQTGELKIFNQAVLGIFPQGGSYLIEDYEHLLENYTEDFTFEELIGSVANETKIKEEDLITPFELDASQENAIIEVKKGRSLTIEGPPGTGKSQVICNLISDFTSRGKKVLVVCQKRAALDTVFDRLSQAHMNNYVALVHDFKADRKTVFDKIATQIGQIEHYQKENESLDAVFIQREFDQVCRHIEQICRELDDFKTSLYDESICQKSIKELYLMRDESIPKITLDEDFVQYKFNDISVFLNTLQDLEEYTNRLKTNGDAYHFWKDRKSLVQTSIFEKNNISSFLQKGGALFENFKENFPKESFGNIKKIVSEKLQESFKSLENKRTWEFFVSFLNTKNTLNSTDLCVDIQMVESLGELKCKYFEIAGFEELELEVALRKSGSYLEKLSFSLFSKQFKSIDSVLKQAGFVFSKKDLQILINEQATLRVFQGIRRKYSNYLQNSTCKGFRADFFAFYDATLAFEYLHKNLGLSFVFESEVFPKQISDAFANLVNEVQQFDMQMHVVFSKAQVANFWKSDISRVSVYFDQNFDLLQEQDQLNGTLNASELKYAEVLSEIENGDAVFTQSLVYRWIDFIEFRNPILKGVSTLKMEQQEARLTDLVARKRAMSKEILGLKLRDYTFADLEKNRLGNVLTYRDLLHQVAKKRAIWPLRKVLSEFSEEIFKLMPCWLVSPETASAIFETTEKALFDLVIFDEASQCFPEQGVPAIAKAKQVLVVGDSKQLQPNDLYKVRFEDQNEAEEELLEIESLMDLATRFLPKTRLTGHYRSQNLSLIAFSNLHFYENELELLPRFVDVNKKAVFLHKINGTWQDQTNTEEAQEVVRIIKEIPFEKSVGVVAFNFKQADLIYKLLEEKGLLTENIKVKNIENIQGDEFDVVVFSVGYAPDSLGVLRFQFGLLNQKGGENRLNVAISRAKEQVHVVTSISSRDLNTSHLANYGPELLRKYLVFVEELQHQDFEFTPPPIHKNWGLNLKTRLIEQGDYAACVLPHADLVRNQHLAVTDDQRFFQSISSKEFFVYKPQLMLQKGWEFKRLWSRNFVKL
jgi:hypothetical protein